MAATVSIGSASKIYDPLTGAGGPPRQHMFNESNLNDLKRPNSTNSVNFTVGNEEFTWRVNVTDFSVPDALENLDNTSEDWSSDPRLVLTTYDLQWPLRNESLNDTAIRLNKDNSAGGSAQSLQGSSNSNGNSSSDDPICVSVLHTPIWPNVTNLYQSENEGDCEAVIGQGCLRSIMVESAYRNGRCQNPDLNKPVCQDAFGYTSKLQAATSISSGYYRDKDNYTTYYSNGDDPQFNMSTHQQTYNGDAIGFEHGLAFDGSNTTAMQQAESRFRMMILTLPGGQKSAVCMRVDPSIDDLDVSPIAQEAGWDEDEESSGDGDGASSGSGGDDEEESAASPHFAVAMGSVGLAGLAAAAFALL